MKKDTRHTFAEDLKRCLIAVDAAVYRAKAAKAVGKARAALALLNDSLPQYADGRLRACNNHKKLNSSYKCNFVYNIYMIIRKEVTSYKACA